MTAPNLEHDLREVGLVMSRVAPDLFPEFESIAGVLDEMRPVIGEIVFATRRRRQQTREEYAGAHNLPVSVLVRVERWRLMNAFRNNQRYELE